VTESVLDNLRLIKGTEVAKWLRVDPRTVTRWANSGKIWSTRTPGGHRRYSESEIQHIAVNGFPRNDEDDL
jgi:excisionase family DNA binding protein